MKNQPLVYKDHQCVDELLARIRAVEGVHYASVEVIKSDVVYSASSHKEWLQEYIEHKLYLDDPVLGAALAVPELPICWDSVALNTLEHVEVMKKRKAAVGAETGITICLEARDRKLLLTVGTVTDDKIVGVITAVLKSLDATEILKTYVSAI